MGCCASTENDRNAAGVYRSYGEDDLDLAAKMVDASSSLTSRIEISISCSNLKNLDKRSKSDPFCIVYMRAQPNTPWTEIKRTEIIANTLNPKWVTLIPLMYQFEEVQMLRFEVFDVDSSFKTSNADSIDVKEQDFQGCAECAIAQIMGALNNTWIGQLQNPVLEDQKAIISVRGEEVANQNADVLVILRAQDLDDLERIGKSDPFLRLSRATEDGAFIPFFKTEVRMNTCSPNWDRIDTTLQQLCNGDMYRPILVECFNWRKSGAHQLIGSCQVSVNDLIGMSVKSLTPASLKKDETKSEESSEANESSGIIHCDMCELKVKPSFLNYISSGGVEIAFSVAIDYTASNGDPTYPGTLHYRDPTGVTLNQYAQAIVGVGNVLEYYDTDKSYPVYGFGGKLGPGEAASHCFPVNGDVSNPEVVGVKGILDAYYNSLPQIELSGPTIFQQVINQVASISAASQTSDPKRQRYYILMIITDGIVNDMQNTTDAIVNACELPLSIIIVGVGSADFKMMEELDGDNQRLKSSQGIKASRDIVQFVPMQEFLQKGPFIFAREILAEVPRQFLQYMEANQIPPASK